ncbi:MAG: HIT family protein [Patescibacteria group bacterium]
MDKSCLFCKIIAKEIPSEVIYENEDTFAFLDINPLHPGHTLIVPKEHSENILEISEKSYKAIAKTARIVAKAIKTGLKPDGVNVHMNNESAAGQVIFHTHLHVIPRYIDDGFLPWHKSNHSQEEITAAGEKIKSSL